VKLIQIIVYLVKNIEKMLHTVIVKEDILNLIQVYVNHVHLDVYLVNLLIIVLNVLEIESTIQLVIVIKDIMMMM